MFERPPGRRTLSGPVAAPDVLERLGQRLLDDPAVAVTGGQREDVLVRVAPGLERRRHAVVGLHPVVHAVAHHVRIVEVAVPDVHPDPEGLARARRDERLVVAPRAARRPRVEGPLLVTYVPE